MLASFSCAAATGAAGHPDAIQSRSRRHPSWKPFPGVSADRWRFWTAEDLEGLGHELSVADPYFVPMAPTSNSGLFMRLYPALPAQAARLKLIRLDPARQGRADTR
jgi:hypothetical protein